MLQDDRTNKQALAGLFDTDMLMSDEFSRSKKNAAPAQQQLQMPTSLVDQMDERHGKFKSRMGLFAHAIGGGTAADYGDEDLKSQYTQDKNAYDMQQKIAGFGQIMPFVNEQIGYLQDDDPTNDAAAFYQLGQAGVDKNMRDAMFPGMSHGSDPDIMRTTKAYVDSYNEKNKDKEGFQQMTFDEGYDIVKNYDPGRRGAQAGAVANASGVADSDITTFNTAQKDYISAFENSDVLLSSLENVDRGIEMLQNGEVDTGLFNGFIFNTFGVGSTAMGELNSLSKNATIDKLMSFKGPTTDFEFSQSEAAAFADIMKGENVNEGTMKTARGAIERAMKRNSTMAEAAYGTMSGMADKTGQRGTFDVVGRNYKPWWESGQQDAGGGGGETAGDTSPMPESEALEWLKNNNTPENRAYFQEVYGKEATL